MSKTREVRAAARRSAIVLILVLGLAACGPNQRERELTSENQSLRTRTAELTAQADELAEALRLALEERAAAATRLAELERERDDVMLAAADAEERWSEAEGRRAGAEEAIDAARAERDTARAALAAIVAERDEAQQDLAAAEEASARLEALAVTVQADADARITLLEASLAAERERATTERERATADERELDEARDLLEQLEVERDVLSRELDGFSTQIAVLTSERDAHVATLAADRDEVVRRAEAAEARASDLEAQARALEASVADADARIDALRAELDDARDGAEAHERDLQEALSRVAATTTERDMVTAELARVRADAADAAAEQEARLATLVGQRDAEARRAEAALGLARERAVRTQELEALAAELDERISMLLRELASERDGGPAAAGATDRGDEAATTREGERIATIGVEGTEQESTIEGLRVLLEESDRAREAAEAELGEARAAVRELERERDRLDRQLGEHVDAAATALDDANERATLLTTRLAELLEQRADLQQATQEQRDELAAVRAALEATQSDVARLSGARGIYTVQGADSLSSIATFFYRNGNRWPDVLEANRNLIDDPDLIFAGMVLIIPN